MTDFLPNWLHRPNQQRAIRGSSVPEISKRKHKKAWIIKPPNRCPYETWGIWGVGSLRLCKFPLLGQLWLFVGVSAATFCRFKQMRPEAKYYISILVSWSASNVKGDHILCFGYKHHPRWPPFAWWYCLSWCGGGVRIRPMQIRRFTAVFGESYEKAREEQLAGARETSTGSRVKGNVQLYLLHQPWGEITPVWARVEPELCLPWGATLQEHSIQAAVAHHWLKVIHLGTSAALKCNDKTKADGLC